MSEKDISADFPFESKFIEVEGSKMHYIEEGEGDPVLFLHGNPTSCYLWRNIIPHVSPKARCIAPDLIGMGKSDKPDLEYRFVDHYKYVEGFIKAMDLKNITVVIHDWGSALGFHYAMSNESNMKGIACMECMLKPYVWDELPPMFTAIFKQFRTPEVGWDLVVNKHMFVERLLPGGVGRGLTETEMAHYREPFKDPATRRPVWKWPNEISIEGEPKDVTEIVTNYHEKFKTTNVPILLFHVKPGAIVMPEQVKWCEENIKNITTIDLGQGIHYVQEDYPRQIGEEIAKWYNGM